MTLTRLPTLVATAVLGFIAAVATASAQEASCPASPAYTPDFSSNHNCLALNGIQYSGPLAYPSTGYPGFYPPVGSTSGTVLRLTPSQAYWAGSAWYTTPQPVANGFSTTFTFQLSSGPADGIAFVVQNSGTSALGPEGCGEGFGNSSANPNCTPVQGPQTGIPSSVAIRLDTYPQSQVDDPGNDVTIQSCADGAPNSIDLSCRIAYYYNVPVTMGDGSVHTVTISYTPTPTLANSPNCFVTPPAGSPTALPCLDVILDGHDLFSGGVIFDMNSIGLASGGNAWVGLTAATGGATANQDILSWTLSTQSQSQTSTVTPSTPATYTYNGGCTSDPSSPGCTGGGYNNSVSENSGSNSISNLVFTAIPIVVGDGTNTLANQEACNAIVDAAPTNGTSPWVTQTQTTQCFVYHNGGGPGIAAPVMFAVSCPPSGICDTTGDPFLAAITSFFSFTCTDNPPLIAPDCTPVNFPSSFGNFSNLTSTTGYPSIGFLEGAGPDPNNPCNPATGVPLFQSNQIVSYVLGDTSSKPVKAGSNPLTSCLVATYDTPGEMPSILINSGPTNGATYQQNAPVTASYTCNAVSTAPDSILGSSYPAEGPYLTVGTCNATSGLTAGGGTPTSSSCSPTSPVLDSCSGTIAIDTSEVGPHTFTVDVEDSAMNTAQQQVAYNVEGNQAPLTLIMTSPLAYNQSETLSYAGGTTAGAVTYTVTSGPCSITGAMLNQLTANSGTGSCMVTATMAGNGNYNPVTSTPASIVTLALVPQVINFTTNAPMTAAYNSSFTVAATGGASGNAVMFSRSGVCSITSTTPGTATYKMNNSTGTCSVIANQLGNANYSAALPVAQTVNANGPLVSMNPTSTNLGTVYYGRSLDPVILKVQNTGTSTASLSASLVVGSGATNKLDFTLLDNFPALNLCSSTLGAGKTCYIVLVFFAGNVGTLSATVNVATNSPGSPLTSTFLANVINPLANFNPMSVSFPTEKVSSHGSSTMNVRLTNTGSGPTPLNISSVSIMGANKSQFLLSNGCGSSLAAGSNCIIAVKFAPTSTGTFSANLTVVDNALAGGGTQTVPLSGRGN